MDNTTGANELNKKGIHDKKIAKRRRQKGLSNKVDKEADSSSKSKPDKDEDTEKNGPEEEDNAENIKVISESLANLQVDDDSEEKEEWEEWLEKDLIEEEAQNKPCEEAKNKISSKAQKEKDAAELLMADELTTVLECSNFPASFKTYHLHDMFREYENQRGGYTIKWMNDTRALIVFSHPSTAKKAYLDNLSNPFATVQPYNGPVDFLQSTSPSPIPRRPQTSTMIARRLVHGALGVRTPVRTPEQREADNELIRVARDEREARRQREEERKKEVASVFSD